MKRCPVTLVLVSLAILSVLSSACSSPVSFLFRKPVPAEANAARVVPRIQDQLAEIIAATQADDSAKLAMLAGERSIDLANGRVHVILTMDINPAPQTDSRTSASSSGSAPSIRQDLADAISAAGATYETADGNNVQVDAPFVSLRALASIPGVRFMRLAYPDQELVDSLLVAFL